MRREELRRALAAVGVVEHLVLGYDDGACDAVPLREAARSIARIICTVRPDTVVTFGPDGFTGHPDHRAVSRWVTAACDLLESPPRVLHPTKTPDFVVRFGELNDRFAVFEAGLPSVRHPADLALHVEPAPAVLERKLAALAAHRSQTAPLLAAVGERGLADWFGAESFVAADLQELTTSSPRMGAADPSVC